MTKGRKPIPVRIKLLKGNPGRRPIPKILNLPPGAPDCPEHLGKIARAEWDRMVQALTPAGILTAADRAILATYCQAWERWVKAEKALKKAIWVTTTDSGFAQQNPLLAIANKAMEQLVRTAAEFGMTPSSRARLGPMGQPQKDDFEDWQKKPKTG